jgi:hypothetical protein
LIADIIFFFFNYCCCHQQQRENKEIKTAATAVKLVTLKKKD